MTFPVYREVGGKERHRDSSCWQDLRESMRNLMLTSSSVRDGVESFIESEREVRLDQGIAHVSMMVCSRATVCSRGAADSACESLLKTSPREARRANFLQQGEGVIWEAI